MIKILIVDDHAAIRDSFRSALEEYDDMIVVGSISDAKLAPIFCREKRPDLVLMDICTAEGASGLEATELIKKELEGIKVVVMTGYDEVTYMPRARKSGADAEGRGRAIWALPARYAGRGRLRKTRSRSTARAFATAAGLPFGKTSLCAWAGRR